MLMPIAVARKFCLSALQTFGILYCWEDPGKTISLSGEWRLASRWFLASGRRQSLDCVCFMFERRTLCGIAQRPLEANRRNPDINLPQKESGLSVVG